jgi:hypothetical protein
MQAACTISTMPPRPPNGRFPLQACHTSLSLFAASPLLAFPRNAFVVHVIFLYYADCNDDNDGGGGDSGCFLERWHNISEGMNDDLPPAHGAQEWQKPDRPKMRHFLTKDKKALEDANEADSTSKLLALLAVSTGVGNAFISSLLMVFVPQQCPADPTQPYPANVQTHSCSFQENFVGLTSVNTVRADSCEFGVWL